jgi:hypothetical protein
VPGGPSTAQAHAASGGYEPFFEFFTLANKPSNECEGGPAEGNRPCEGEDTGPVENAPGPSERSKLQHTG